MTIWLLCWCVHASAWKSSFFSVVLFRFEKCIYQCTILYGHVMNRILNNIYLPPILKPYQIKRYIRHENTKRLIQINATFKHNHTIDVHSIRCTPCRYTFGSARNEMWNHWFYSPSYFFWFFWVWWHWPVDQSSNIGTRHEAPYSVVCSTNSMAPSFNHFIDKIQIGILPISCWQRTLTEISKTA